MSEDADYLYALEIQNRLNAADESRESDIEELEVKDVDYKVPIRNVGKYHDNQDVDYLNRTQNLVHPEWETVDPTPDIFAMFNRFDTKFFQCRLKCVTIEWSKRMYSCAGICYQRKNRLGMEITIRLSEPLLKLRARKDLVETMLHEMIHAYCFVLNIREGNGGHGPNFKKIMYAINKVAGTNITVYHTFHDEVDLYKQHWWRCNGVCQWHSPFFGYVKRTCNRAPGPNDQWWVQHLTSCGGTFCKIKEPEKKPKRKNTGKASAKRKNTNECSDLRFGGNKKNEEIKQTENTAAKKMCVSSVEFSLNVDLDKELTVNSEKKLALKKDDDVIIIEPEANEIIDLLSESEDEDFQFPKSVPHTIMTSEERKKAIKKVIIDETTDLNLSDKDILLIDDDYDDNEAAIVAANELADTSIIDEFFGEDLLMEEFRRENDVVPSGSLYHKDPKNDIVTCPICLSKFQRQVLDEHLNGCTGITTKLLPPERLSKNVPYSSSRRQSKHLRNSAKDILRRAGYSATQLAGFYSSTSSDDQNNSLSTDINTTKIEVGEMSPQTINFETERQRRQRNLFKTTRQCPCCGVEFEPEELFDHLDDCGGS